MENTWKWLRYDITEAGKVIFRLAALAVVLVSPALIRLVCGEDSFKIVILLGIVGSAFFVWVIIPLTYSKEIWKGDGELSEYYLIRSWGRFKLIKTGVFGNFSIIQDLNKDGVPDEKVDKHFMGRFGYFSYWRELEDLDYTAFRIAMSSVCEY